MSLPITLDAPSVLLSNDDDEAIIDRTESVQSLALPLIAALPQYESEDRIMRAVEDGDTDGLISLVADERISFEVRGEAVITAAKIENLRMIQILMSYRAEIPDMDRGCAIVIAAQKRNLPIVALLINEFASIPHPYPGLALKEAAQNQDAEIVQILLEHCNFSESDILNALNIPRNTPQIVRLLENKLQEMACPSQSQI